MRRLASVIAILALLLTAAPLSACVTGTAMSSPQSECCRAMHGDCGGMAKMACCQTTVQTDEQTQLATVAPQSDVHWAVIAWLAPAFAQTHQGCPASVQAQDDHSPPGLLIAQAAILRI